MRRHPYSVVLFDELEKAHPDIFNILLQVLDDGSLTDSRGRRVDFRNTVVIMTSNVGAEQGGRASVGFAAGGRDERERERMKAALKEAFRPEFLNRVDEVVVFRRLDEPHLRRIASLLLDELRERVTEREIYLTCTEDAVSLIASEGMDPAYGARPLRRAVIRLIEEPLAEEILTGRISAGDAVTVTAADGKIRFDVAT